jgi:hypothetical protein
MERMLLCQGFAVRELASKRKFCKPRPAQIDTQLYRLALAHHLPLAKPVVAERSDKSQS